MSISTIHRHFWSFLLALCCFAGASVCFAGDFRVIVVRARLLPTKADQSCWDICGSWQKSTLLPFSRVLQKKKGELAWQNQFKKNQIFQKNGHLYMPDPYAIVRFSNGQKMRTSTQKNTLTPEWGTTAQVALKPKDSIEIEVWDKDWRKDDRIGHFSFQQIPAHLLKQGGSLTVRFQQVYSITLLFVKIQSATRALFLPGLYDVTIVRAKLQNKKKNGTSWDIFGGKPDPFVRLRIGTQAITTPHQSNTTNPSWHYAKRIYLNGHEKLVFTIWDRDIRLHDQMAECHYPMVAQVPLDAKGYFRGQCQAVRLFIFRLKKIR